MAGLAEQQPLNRLTISPLTGTIGAEIAGVDLREPIPDDTLAAIRTALLKHKVIFFRDQDISEEQHIAFGRLFGELDIHPTTPADQNHPEIWHLRNTPENGRTADRWHADLTWRERPSLGSILRGRVIPEVGGDTLFSDMVAAYEGLSPAMKQWVTTLTAFHDGGLFAKPDERAAFYERYPVQEHPVVIVHPETGERALYVNVVFTTHIEGLSKKESDWLLNHLFSQASRPEYQCRFRWKRNSIAFWDNRSCQHCAIGDFPDHRSMERVTVLGNKPFFDEHFQPPHR